MNGGMDGTVADHPAYRAHRAVKEKEKDGWRDGAVKEGGMDILHWKAKNRVEKVKE